MYLNPVYCLVKFKCQVFTVWYDDRNVFVITINTSILIRLFQMFLLLIFFLINVKKKKCTYFTTDRACRLMVSNYINIILLVLYNHIIQYQYNAFISNNKEKTSLRFNLLHLCSLQAYFQLLDSHVQLIEQIMIKFVSIVIVVL